MHSGDQPPPADHQAPQAATPRQQAPAPLRSAKEALRAQLIALREALPAQEHATRSEAIARGVTDLESWGRAKVVLLTLPIRGEWNARLLATAAFAAGKQVILPRVDVAARMLVLHRVDDLARDIVPGYRAIPEPRPECQRIAPEVVDWVLVPGVAFDASGHRLGYGGGYYDRLLPLLPAAAARVAGVFDLQIVDSVPHALHDLPVDVIVTESRQITAGARKA